jgi:hypothetical protein
MAKLDLEAEDRQWREKRLEGLPDDECLRTGWDLGSLDGIYHERHRMRLALDELLFRGPHCAKSELLLAVRKHLGLEEPK